LLSRIGYQQDMDLPKFCPICGIEQLEPMFVDCTVQPLFDGEVHPLGGGLRVYWCANSHIFMLLDCDRLTVAPSALSSKQWTCRRERRSFVVTNSGAAIDL
jgi:hypothetical protein